jgi:uncharacterized membrane protein YoaK (UPF0700 family)
MSTPGTEDGGGRDERAQVLLTLTAGAVNAFGFLSLGGVFTSVVTANSALIGIGLGSGHLSVGGLAALAVLGYIAGAAGGSWLAAHRGDSYLAAELLVLWAVAAGWAAAGGHPHGAARTALLVAVAAAMGCQSAGLRVTAGAGVTTAYLTGLLTGAVAELVTARRLQTRSLLVVAALVAGAAAFALTERGLRGAAAALPALLATAAWLEQRRARRRPSGGG